MPFLGICFTDDCRERRDQARADRRAYRLERQANRLEARSERQLARQFGRTIRTDVRTDPGATVPGSDILVGLGSAGDGLGDLAQGVANAIASSQSGGQLGTGSVNGVTISEEGPYLLVGVAVLVGGAFLAFRGGR